PLFDKTDALAFTLTADFKTINKDRRSESTTRYPGVISVTDDRGREQTIKVKLSPRGHFRRMARNCAFVPLRVEFAADEVAGTMFDGQTSNMVPATSSAANSTRSGTDRKSTRLNSS